METNNTRIEFYTKERAKEKSKKYNNVFVFSIFMLIISVLFFATLSFISVRAVINCAATAKNQASTGANFYNQAGISGMDNKVMQLGTENILLKSCVKNNFFAGNALYILGVSFNYVGIFFLSLLYLFIFEKSENSIKIGRAVIIALILSIMTLLALPFGILGGIVALIVGTWMVMGILGTNIFDAAIFIALIGFLNWILMNVIAKLLA